MRYLYGIYLLLTITGSAFTESKVHEDAIFPYRLVCPAAWEEIEKNDSLVVLQDVSPGKKAQLKLRKYPINTSVILEPMNWSRINYTVNREFASELGEVLSSDTSSSKKIGDLRAFEFLALYTEEAGDKTVWWAEYCRWTERNNFGYLVQIMGDTLDIQENFSTYKAVMDSIRIMDIATPIAVRKLSYVTTVVVPGGDVRARYDLLGRKELQSVPPRSGMLLQNGKKVLQMQELFIR